MDASNQLVANKQLEIHIMLLCFDNISELCLDFNIIVISSPWENFSEGRSIKGV